MNRKMGAARHLGLVICLLVGASSACNLGSGGEDEEPLVIPPTDTRPVPTVDAPETLPANIAPSTSTPVAAKGGTENDSEPVEAPTLANTTTPTATPTSTPEPISTIAPSPTLGITPTDKPIVSQGPLEFTYTLSWRFKDALAQEAILTVSIIATGGSGVYTYRVDEETYQEGPIFEIPGHSCRPSIHTLWVFSSDGQSSSSPTFFSEAPCPTPTPTP